MRGACPKAGRAAMVTVMTLAIRRTLSREHISCSDICRGNMTPLVHHVKRGKRHSSLIQSQLSTIFRAHEGIFFDVYLKQLLEM